MGPSVSTATLAAMGAMVVHAGLYDTRTKIRLIADLKPTVVSGTASYLLHVPEVAREMGVDLAALGIRTVSAHGEPGPAAAKTRDLLRRAWGAQRIADGYGMTEIFPLGGNCPHSSSLHIASDIAATEIVDPESGAPVPLGETGEVVITNLVGESQPLLRYRTRDIARLETSESCACGFTGSRLEGSILGRVDDMIWFRGVNVYPSAIEAALREIPELGAEYQIEVSGDAALPRMAVRAESAQADVPEANAQLRERVAAAIRQAVRVSVDVEILRPGALPRPDGRSKAKRVVDRRARG
jgi:phenylacetate-CoA ligase